MSRKMKGHILEPIPSLVAIRPDVPPEVDAIYRKLMAKEPNERFGTAEELIPALTPIIKQAVAARAGRGSVSGSAPSSDSNSSSISISGFLPAAVAALTAATPAAPAETPVATDLVNSVPPSLPAASAEPASTTLGGRRAGRLWAIAGAALLAVAVILGIAVLLL